MPYKNKADRDYKRDYKTQKARGESEAATRRKRAQTRYEYDKEGIDRTGKDIDHKRALSKGGTAARSNTRLTDPSTNRSFARNADGSVKANKPYPKAKRNPVQNRKK